MYLKSRQLVNIKSVQIIFNPKLLALKGPKLNQISIQIKKQNKFIIIITCYVKPSTFHVSTSVPDQSSYKDSAFHKIKIHFHISN